MPYNASKSSVISITQAYALALAPFDINVNAICPGLLWTPMWERIATRTINLNDSMEGTTPREAFEQFVAQSIPLGREQTPQDIGRLGVFLASDLAFEHHWPGDKRQWWLRDELTATPHGETRDP